MIISNLKTTGMAASLGFYRDMLGLDLDMAISADRAMLSADDAGHAVFAVLDLKGSKLMLQSAASLAEEFAFFDEGPVGAPNGTLYIRDVAIDQLLPKIAENHIVSGPTDTWYGMREVVLRDPDGHIVCLAEPQGAPPDMAAKSER